MTVDDKQLLAVPEGLTATSGTIKAQLDLLLLGIEALSGESSEAVLKTAEALGLSQWIDDRVTLWRLRNANPLRRSSGGRKNLDIDETRALVLIIANLARQFQSRIRETVTQLEAAVAAERSPFKEPLVGDYLDEFHAHYRSRMIDGDDRSSDSITELALRLLIDLLFYSSSKGPQRLWVALLHRPAMELPDWAASDSEPEDPPAYAHVSDPTPSPES